MSVLVSIATGNASAAATWGVVDPTSYLNAQHVTESLLNTSYSGTKSSAFTPGAITISHICVKLCEVMGTTGTMSVHLYNNTDVADVAGTEVTIDVADLPSSVLEVDSNGGWIAFKLASPVLLVAGKSYSVEAKTSVSTRVDLWCDGTTDNIARCLVTTTTAAPAAGDDMIVCGEKTGSGTGNDFTVTWDITTATDFGGAPSASNGPILPALAVCDGGTLTWATSAATNYIMRLSGSLIIYSGGLYNQGTVATPCPRDSSMELQIDCAADGDYGIGVRNGGTCIMQGQSRTSGKNIWYCKLNTDEAIASTSLSVDTDTGWLDDDAIAVASTTRTATDCEVGLLNGAAGVSTLTVDGFLGAGGGLAAAHSGTAGALPTQAEIILLTRNVRCIAATTTASPYMHVTAGGVVDLDWVSFQYWGTNVSYKRGIEVYTTVAAGGSFSARYCSLRDSESYCFYLTGATADNITVEYCAFWNGNTANASTQAFIYLSSITAVPTALLINGNIGIKITGGTSVGLSIAACAGTITNNTLVGASTGIEISGAEGLVMVFSGNTAHSNSGVGFNLNGGGRGYTYTDTTCWRNGGAGTQLGNQVYNATFNGLVLYGNNVSNIVFSGCGLLTYIGLVSNSDSILVTTNGITVSGSTTNIEIRDSAFSGTATHTQDINSPSSALPGIKFINCTFSAATTVLNPTTTIRAGVITSLKHGGVIGDHRTWKPNGRNTGCALERDTTIFNTASPSLRMYPGHATRRLQGPSWEAAVASGNTLSVSVTVRESVIGDGTAYAGYTIHPKLWVRANAAAGITADTLLATHGGGAGWVTLSGTTAAVTDDAILEFYVDCEGTAGWINVDDFTCVSPDSQGLKFWSAEHGGPLALGQPVGGAGSIIIIED